jgi:transcriptional regulator with GAF, ATPase, and Fis domain
MLQNELEHVADLGVNCSMLRTITTQEATDFLREVTLRMCGTLEIERALFSVFLYVRDVMPADQLILTVYDRELGSLRIVASASETGGRLHEDRIFLPPELRREIENAEKYQRVRMAENVFDDPVICHVARYQGWNPSAMIVARLLIDGLYAGALTVRAEQPARYTDKELGLWSLINEPAAVALTNSERFLEVLRLKELLSEENSYLQKELRKTSGIEVVGADFGLRSVMDKVLDVAPLNSPVLLLGETGTGKEVIANAIHTLSARRDGPLVKVNCGALPDSLIDSELFGHERGAFTGAINQKPGRFERAHGGTLFLDEIAELPLLSQARFLRVLQEKEIERVGGTHPIKVDVRVLSASNRDLEQRVASGRFREDLYFRLKVFPIVVPPLRERKADIPSLVHHFIHKKSREMVLPAIPTLAAGAIDRLMAYDWPGNVRELENAVEREIILARGTPLSFVDTILPAPLHAGARLLPVTTGVLLLKDVEAAHIRRLLDLAGGRVEGRGGAAELLGLPPATLRFRMKKLGIPFGRKQKSIIATKNALN